MNTAPLGTQARHVVDGATTDPVEHMEREGWHRCTEVLSADAAFNDTIDQLGDRDYSVRVTRTSAGFIVWTKLIGIDKRGPTA